jgi:hypothetical protein
MLFEEAMTVFLAGVFWFVLFCYFAFLLLCLGTKKAGKREGREDRCLE